MKQIVTSLCCFLTVVFACVAMASEKGTLLFGVNEGTSGSANFQQMQDKYSRLLTHLGGVLKSPMRLESATDLKNLTTSLKKSRFDFLLVRPSHISAKAMRDQKYVLVAAAKGDARTFFIVTKDSPLKTPADIAGKRIAMPDPLAYPTVVGLAMLRNLGLDVKKEQIQFFRVQEAVGYAVENKMVDVGVVVAYSKVAKNWKASGGRVLLESKPVPFWSIIASPKVSEADVGKVRAALIKLDQSDEGKKILKDIGVTAFEAGDAKRYADMLEWVRYE